MCTALLLVVPFFFPCLCDTRITGKALKKKKGDCIAVQPLDHRTTQHDYEQKGFALEGVFFFLPFVRNRVVLFCGLVAERQYNPPSSSTHSDIIIGKALL